MKAEPHTHEVRIRREFGSAGGPIRVTYGDTTVSTLPLLLRPFGAFITNHPSERRVRLAMAEAVRKHDRGSQKAGAEAAFVDGLRAEVDEVPPGSWASEVIGAKTTRPAR